jgi:peptide subunit release factor 1 (eRF1)
VYRIGVSFESYTLFQLEGVLQCTLSSIMLPSSLSHTHLDSSLQAIELSADILKNVKFIQEKRLIGKYFEEIAQNTGKYVYGVDDTLKALDAGAVETLLVWENLDINHYTLKNPNTGGEPCSLAFR